MANVFAVQIFFIMFRECLEAIVILSVLFSFLKQSMGQDDHDQVVYKRLRRQVWLGAFTGIAICLIIGGAFIGVFYGLGKDIWAQSEELWEGIFYLIATVIISVMGLALLRVNKMRDKWRVKISEALAEKNKSLDAKDGWHLFGIGPWIRDWSRRHVMFILPFITTMREGVEAVVFIGGVSLSLPASAFPLPVICGALAAILIGYFLYRGGNMLSIQIFLIVSTSVLYLIAAGMFSKAVWDLQYHVFANKVGSDVAEEGNGPGSYDIRESVWHVNCCNAETDNGWDVFNALLGWENSATYGSVLAYNLYWLALIVAISCLFYEERTGHLPLGPQILSIASRVPGFRGWAKRKQAKTEDEKCTAPVEAVQGEGVISTV
ncbi:iron permease FTR1 [Sarocladium strictum]